MRIDPITYLQAELQRLDLLLHRELLRFRAAYQLSLDEFRGLYITDEQVDAYVQAASNGEDADPAIAALTAQAAALRAANAAHWCPDLPWVRLAAEFGLCAFEIDTLLLALAPEIDVKYETIYAYLNNDVGRKRPSHNLALRLFSVAPADRADLRRYLLPTAALFRDGLLVPAGRSTERPAWLSSGFAIVPAVAAYLLGLPVPAANAAPLMAGERPDGAWADIAVPDELRAAIDRAAVFFGPDAGGRPPPILVLEGRYGAGRRSAATALCRRLGIRLLRLDLAAPRAAGEALVALLSDLALHARLERAGVLVESGEALFGPESQLLPEGPTLAAGLAGLPGPVLFACAPGTPWRELLRGRRCLLFHFGEIGHDDCRRLWSECLAEAGASAPDAAVDALASRFTLTPGQVRAAVAAALDARALGDQVDAPLTLDALLEAARAQSDGGLGRLAIKVATIHTWDDLVLPPGTLRRVREIAAAIQHHHLVYSQWGFDRRITAGRGIKVLFAGASGTGKTMAAAVIARGLGLDLYKIDLSGIVSKYIGETEKNLDRIFQAAQASNAILFFDEADALFGKRSEVKDAHDRYANIEVAYLLQKLEEHEGAVILASNLSHNIDNAFSRRMHYVVEFPLPDEQQRERLWRGMFPTQAPLDPEVDFPFLARQFAIPGGDIQNVVLDAAFLAAADGHVVTMAHLVRAMARQMLKRGRVPSAIDFREYYGLVGI